MQDTRPLIAPASSAAPLPARELSTRREAGRILPLAAALAALTLIAAIALATLPSLAAANSIAFLRNGNIWRASPDGSHQVQLTTDGTEAEPYNELAAAKGPGAPLLSFRKDYDLGVIEADGSGERMLPNLTSGMADTSVSLSPTGEAIAYQAQEYGVGLWFDVAITAGVASDSNLMNFGFFVQWASFSNEQGSEVLLSQLSEYGAGDPSCTDAEGGEYFQLAYVDVSQNPGNQLSTICKASLDEDLESPAVSPDFKQFAVSVSHHVGETPAQIVVFPRSGEGEGKALTGEIGARYPDWSPDGKQIAFELDNGSEHAIYTVPVSGGTPKKIIEDATRPAWTAYGSSTSVKHSGRKAGRRHSGKHSGHKARKRHPGKARHRKAGKHRRAAGKHRRAGKHKGHK